MAIRRLRFMGIHKGAFQIWQIQHGGHFVIQQIGVTHHAGFFVNDHLFENRPTDAHSHPAVYLSFRQHGVQDMAGVVHIQNAVDGDFAQLDIHRKIDKGATEGRRVSRRFYRGFRGELPAALRMVKRVHGDIRYRQQRRVRAFCQHHIAANQG